MPSPRQGYFLSDGSRVPGTTTIIGRFKDSAGLMQWAFQQGKAGKIHLHEDSEKAAEVGTIAHGMVEMRIKKKADWEIAAYAEHCLPDDVMRQRAWSAFKAYDAWAANFNVKIMVQEIQLVSEKYRYGGTPDAIGIINDQFVLLDWKTSNAIYADYLIQLAAYRQLWEENRPDQPITGGFHLLRFGKEHADFAHHYFPNLDSAWEQFKLFRQAYEIDKELKKRAA